MGGRSQARPGWRARSSRRYPTARPQTIACSRGSTACTGCACGWPSEQPLALIVDDAHWADEHSLRFLAYMEARIEEIPACLIVALRTGEAAAAPDALAKLTEHEPATAIRPRPLSPAAIAELVRGSLGADTGHDVCAECARTTGGNPLLARQLIASLEERDGGSASLDASAIVAMGPPSVARFVAARLSRRPRRSEPSRGHSRSSATMRRWRTPRTSRARSAAQRRPRSTR